MNSSLQRHRGGVVLAFGILSVVPPMMVIPFGLAGWFMASKDIRAMNAGRMDGSGRAMTQLGQVIAALGASIWLACAVWLVLWLALTSHS